jgi:uncharacterized protein YhbP (UPF0306 family)
VSNDVTQLALAYLGSHQVMTLATYGPNGVWAAAVFYVNRAFDLFFLSAEHTRHGRNMQAEPRVAATIQEDYEDWPAIKGIQLEGMVRPLYGNEQQAAIILYQTRYPFIAQADEQMQAALTRVKWYHLTPDRFYFIDNSKGLGHRDEVKLHTLL